MSNHFLLETYGLAIADGAASTEDANRWQVRELLSGLYPTGAFERRREQRYPLPKLLQLLPVAADGRTPLGPMITASGKHISETGLSFFHPQPLAYRLVIVSVEKPDRSRAEFLLDVDWCRFTQLGWYESGGRFLKLPAAESPPAQAS